MYVSELLVENFRVFGEGPKSLLLPLKPGLTTIVGENDTGKSAITDAVRLALGSRDHEYFRIDESDFHHPGGAGERARHIRIRCKFDSLTVRDKAAFAEYLTFEADGASPKAVLYVNWKAVRTPKAAGQRRFTLVEVKSGKLGDGPQFDPEARNLLCTTYLRPLRDAERSLSAGRGSRLSQILEHTKEIVEEGSDYEPKTGVPHVDGLSVLGIGTYTNALLEQHKGVQKARDRLNEQYLRSLSFTGDELLGAISVSGAKGDASVRLRQLLEKLDLELRDAGSHEPPPSRGLGSNNLLFMACELLLLGSEEDGFPLLLIEEPEAHLHPQRQLRLMQFLSEKASEPRPDNQLIQVIVTSHSPNLASGTALGNLVLLRHGKAYALSEEYTMLEKGDYNFLQRFLDATKANLFFARGLIIVEGDAENILMPVLARLLGRDLTANGVSIVNVGGTGLHRFARIYQRKCPATDGVIDVPVACVTDFDVMPDCAPAILGRTKAGQQWPCKKGRRWRARRDFTLSQLEEKRASIVAKASGQCVKSFVADRWTLEFDLAASGLAEEVHLAGLLAKFESKIIEKKTTREAVIDAGRRSFARICANGATVETIASRIYAPFVTDSAVSKATAAQYLAGLLEAKAEKGELKPDVLKNVLPPYLVQAIEYVTSSAAPMEQPEATRACDSG